MLIPKEQRLAKGTRIRLLTNDRRARVVQTHYGASSDQLGIVFEDTQDIARVNHDAVTTDVYTAREKALHEVLGYAASAASAKRAYERGVAQVVTGLRRAADDVEREFTDWQRRHADAIACPTLDPGHPHFLVAASVNPSYHAADLLREVTWMTPNTGISELPRRAAEWHAVNLKAHEAVVAFTRDHGAMTEEEQVQLARATK